jgi:hypothetical protein
VSWTKKEEGGWMESFRSRSDLIWQAGSKQNNTYIWAEPAQDFLIYAVSERVTVLAVVID